MQASIQRILEVKPVENADSLDKVYVLGWQVVVKRGEFKPNDLCVYIGIDTIVPARPEFAFLAKEKFRIRTKKFRGALSQGLCLPLTVLKNYGQFLNENGDLFFIPNQDIEKLVVQHIEKP